MIITFLDTLGEDVFIIKSKIIPPIGTTINYKGDNYKVLDHIYYYYELHTYKGAIKGMQITVLKQNN